MNGKMDVLSVDGFARPALILIILRLVLSYD